MIPNLPVPDYSLFEDMAGYGIWAMAITGVLIYLYERFIGGPRERQRRYEQQRLQYSKARMEAIRRGEI